MNNHKIIDQILSKNSKLTRKEIINEIEIKKQKTGNLIDEKTLLRVVGAKYGIKNSPKTAFNEMLTISDLLSGLYNVSIKGRVVAIFPVKSFQGINSGKLLSLIISDKNAMIRVILWNEKTELIKVQKIRIGDLILVSKGYTRDDYRGKIELHIGKKGEIRKIDDKLKQKDYPSILQFSNKIIEITSQLNEVNLVGKVREIYPMKRYVRSDSKQGALLRFVISDETGEIPVLMWNEQAENTESLIKKNRKIYLINAKVDQNNNNSIEIHVNSNTYLHFYKENKN
jgi:replication factor A1